MSNPQPQQASTPCPCLEVDMWEFASCFLNSGILMWNLLFYPFILESHGSGVYWLFHSIILVGVIRPILMMEMAVGQLNQCGILSLWGKMVPILQGLGWASALVTIFVGSSTSYVSSLSLNYLWNSLTTSSVPWSNDTVNENLTKGNVTFGPADDYYRNVSFVSANAMDDSLSVPQWHLLFCMALLWILVFILNFRRTPYTILFGFVLSTFQYILLLILFIGSVVNGASPGVYFDVGLSSFSVLFDAQFWINVVGQCFVYFPMGLGTLTAISSECSIHFNIPRAATLICILGFLTERLVGVFLYTVLNHISEEMCVTTESLYKGGPVLLFVKLLTYFSSLPAFSQILTLLLFLFLTITSLNGIIMFFRGIKGIWQEVFPKLSECQLAAAASICGFLLGLPYLTNHGKVLLYIVSTYGVELMKQFIVFLQLVGINIYNSKKFRVDFEFMIGRKLSRYTKLAWKIGLFVVMMANIGNAIVNTHFTSYYKTPIPSWAVATGCGISFIVLLSFLLPGVYEILCIYEQRKEDDISILEVMKKSCTNKPTLGPPHELQRRRWKEYRRNQLFLEKTNSPMRISYWT